MPRSKTSFVRRRPRIAPRTSLRFRYSKRYSKRSNDANASEEILRRQGDGCATHRASPAPTSRLPGRRVAARTRDVVVEILSTGSRGRDLQLKRRLYERFAIPEYWIVDPDHASLEICRMDAGRYGIRARFDRTSTLTSPDFAELAVPLLGIFRQG